MDTKKRQFKEKSWDFELWNDQLRPFLKSLSESHKITKETSDHIRRSLMMQTDELQQHQKDNKDAEWVIPDYKSRAKDLVLISPEYTKDELLKKMREQNYFKEDDEIQNVDQLWEEYLNFVKKHKMGMKEWKINSLLANLRNIKTKKSNLQRAREDFIEKNDREQWKCDDKINIFKKKLQKIWYKGEI